MVLPKKVAIEVAKDLVRLDKAEEEIVLLNSMMTVEVRKATVLRAIVNDQVVIIDNQAAQISMLNQRFDLRTEESEYWKKQMKKQKRQKFLVGGVGLALLILLGVSN